MNRIMNAAALAQLADKKNGVPECLEKLQERLGAAAEQGRYSIRVGNEELVTGAVRSLQAEGFAVRPDDKANAYVIAWG